MGNCLPKPRRNRKKKKDRSSPDHWARKCTPEQTNVSEILSFSSSSSFNASYSSDEELKMVENMSITSDVEYTSVKTFIIEREGSTPEALVGKIPKVESPVAFQLTYGPKEKTMPQRLASRMENRMTKSRLEMNLSELVGKQQKMKYFQQAKDGKYVRICKSDASLENEYQKQVDRMQTLSNIVDRLNQEYPHAQPALRRATVNLSTKMTDDEA